jgi:hypothetical protein
VNTVLGGRREPAAAAEEATNGVCMIGGGGEASVATNLVGFLWKLSLDQWGKCVVIVTEYSKD